MEEIRQEIERLKKEQDAVILAHYYVNEEIQSIADYVGDSFFLSQIASTVTQNTIVLCGVSFMGESAKILNPGKRILLPDLWADCPMAHMASISAIREMRERYDGLAVVCYINSSAAIKALSDVCVTSANAVEIVRSLPNSTIYMIPDGQLARYIAKQVPEKRILLGDGYCHVHTKISRTDVENAKRHHPDALVLVHPECTQEVHRMADFIGSTGGMIDYVSHSSGSSFIVCTESGILTPLKAKNPSKQFYLAHGKQECPGMKRITLKKVLATLRDGQPSVHLDDSLMQAALPPLQRMMELGGSGK